MNWTSTQARHAHFCRQPFVTTLPPPSPTLWTPSWAKPSMPSVRRRRRIHRRHARPPRYRNRIATLISEPDNLYDAMNKGIAATGDVVAILNADDVCSTDVLARVAATFRLAERSTAVDYVRSPKSHAAGSASLPLDAAPIHPSRLLRPVAFHPLASLGRGHELDASSTGMACTRLLGPSPRQVVGPPSSTASAPTATGKPGA